MLKDGFPIGDMPASIEVVLFFYNPSKSYWVLIKATAKNRKALITVYNLVYKRNQQKLG